MTQDYVGLFLLQCDGLSYYVSKSPEAENALYNKINTFDFATIKKLYAPAVASHDFPLGELSSKLLKLVLSKIEQQSPEEQKAFFIVSNSRHISRYIMGHHMRELEELGRDRIFIHMINSAHNVIIKLPLNMQLEIMNYDPFLHKDITESGSDAYIILKIVKSIDKANKSLKYCVFEKDRARLNLKIATLEAFHKEATALFNKGDFSQNSWDQVLQKNMGLFSKSHDNNVLNYIKSFQKFLAIRDNTPPPSYIDCLVEELKSTSEKEWEEKVLSKDIYQAIFECEYGEKFKQEIITKLEGYPANQLSNVKEYVAILRKFSPNEMPQNILKLEKDAGCLNNIVAVIEDYKNTPIYKDYLSKIEIKTYNITNIPRQYDLDRILLPQGKKSLIAQLIDYDSNFKDKNNIILNNLLDLNFLNIKKANEHEKKRLYFSDPSKDLFRKAAKRNPEFASSIISKITQEHADFFDFTTMETLFQDKDDSRYNLAKAAFNKISTFDLATMKKILFLAESNIFERYNVPQEIFDIILSKIQKQSEEEQKDFFLFKSIYGVPGDTQRRDCAFIKIISLANNVIEKLPLNFQLEIMNYDFSGGRSLTFTMRDEFLILKIVKAIDLANKSLKNCWSKEERARLNLKIANLRIFYQEAKELINNVDFSQDSWEPVLAKQQHNFPQNSYEGSYTLVWMSEIIIRYKKFISGKHVNKKSTSAYNTWSDYLYYKLGFDRNTPYGPKDFRDAVNKLTNNRDVIDWMWSDNKGDIDIYLAYLNTLSKKETDSILSNFRFNLARLDKSIEWDYFYNYYLEYQLNSLLDSNNNNKETLILTKAMSDKVAPSLVKDSPPIPSHSDLRSGTKEKNPSKTLIQYLDNIDSIDSNDYDCIYKLLKNLRSKKSDSMGEKRIFCTKYDELSSKQKVTFDKLIQQNHSANRDFNLIKLAVVCAHDPSSMIKINFLNEISDYSGEKIHEMNDLFLRNLYGLRPYNYLSKADDFLASKCRKLSAELINIHKAIMSEKTKSSIKRKEDTITVNTSYEMNNTLKSTVKLDKDKGNERDLLLKILKNETIDNISSYEPWYFTYEEYTDNALTAIIKSKKYEHLPNVVKKINSMSEEDRVKILKVCSRHNIRLLDISACAGDHDAQKALYLLEIERVCAGLDAGDIKNSLLALHKKLWKAEMGTENKTKTFIEKKQIWLREIQDTRDLLKSKMTISDWFVSAIYGRAGYGVGFFKPSINDLLLTIGNNIPEPDKSHGSKQ